jgi:mono/diheme cytochrome c family protein
MTLAKLRPFTVALLASTLLAPLAASAAGNAAAGKTLYTANCASCHGDTGKGDGPVGKSLNPPPRDYTKGEFKFDTDKDGKTGTDADLAAVIKNGAMKFGGSPLMAPWPAFTDAQVADLIAFIRSLKQ